MPSRRAFSRMRFSVRNDSANGLPLPGRGTPIAHTRDTAGPMAREVADLVLLDTIITGARDKVVAAPLKGLRLGV